MPARRRSLLAAVLAVTALAASGCGDDDDSAVEDATGTTEAPAATEATGTTTGGSEATTTRPTDLPELSSLTEDNLEGLQAVYGPPLGELDLLVTRGGVVDYRGGTHLQLYVEPTTDEAANPPQVYLDRMLTSFQAIIPLLFDAYPEMDSFDLCQEPVPEPGDPPVEPGYEEPVTLLLITREGYESVDDWSTATLDDLFDAADDDLGGYSSITPEISALPAFQEATADPD